MYVERNVAENSRNHCCHGKEMSITFSESVFVTLGIQHAMRMRRIAMCGLSGPTKLFHLIS
jgi:hypothetical protein